MTATKQSEITAGLRVNPNFNLTGSDVSLAANSNNPYFYSAQVSRLFERGQKRRWRLDVAHSTTDVTRSQYADQERQVVLAVKTAFTQMLGAKGAFDLAKQNLDDYRKTIDLSRERLRAGDISATDFKRLDLQLAQFESDYDNAHTNLVQASDAVADIARLRPASPGLRHHRLARSSGDHRNAPRYRAKSAAGASGLPRRAAVGASWPTRM